MKHTFDLIEAINLEALMYTECTSNKPSTISVSRNSYRRLLELKLQELNEKYRHSYCSPLEFIAIGDSRIKIEVDETLGDTDIRFS